MDFPTYQALGLDRPFDPRLAGGIDWNRYLQPPEDGQYNPCPEANPGPDVPRGSVRHSPQWSGSRVYPGTRRDISVYVPPRPEADREAGLMVFMDGGHYLDPAGAVRAPAVLDSLLAAGELPPVVAVFVSPGSSGGSEDHRSIEYDTLTPRYSEFLVTELLPFVAAEHGVSFTGDPARRMVCGISSGGICAFTAAWFAPSAFGLVLSHCGSFTNIRGGHNYPYLVRTTSRKPIRVFLTSGALDLDHPVGNWPLANQEMASALAFAGYEYRFEFGAGGHSLRHGGSLFAESLRWLWRPR